MLTTRLILALYKDGRTGVVEEAGGKYHITQVVPNHLKVGEVG